MKPTLYTLFSTILTLSLLLGGHTAKAEKFSHLSIDDGLSQNTVFAIVQDSLGRMWFGTGNGLDCYDGYNFTSYYHEDGNENSICHNSIRTLHFDCCGRLWIATLKGLSLFDAENENFRNFLIGRQINDIVDIDENHLLIACKDGFYCMDINSGELIDSLLNEIANNIEATKFLKNGNRIYIGTEGECIYIYDIESREIRKYANISGMKPVHEMLIHGNSLLLASEGSGLYRIDMDKGTVSNFSSADGSLKSDYIRALKICNDELWIGTVGGLSIFNGETFRHITAAHDDDRSLSQNSIRCICRDNQGGVWLGTFFGGVNYCHSEADRFQHIQAGNSDKNLSSKVINRIVEDSDGSLWIGTNNGGINRYFPDTENITVYMTPNSPEDVKAIYIDGRDIYVGSHAGGLSIIQGKEIRKLTQSRLDIYDIKPKNNGELWLGTLGGLYCYNKLSRRIDHVYDTRGINLDGLRIRTLFIDRNNILWTADEETIKCFSTTPYGLAAIEIIGENSQENILNSIGGMNCIYQTKNETWIGTKNGLYCLTGLKLGTTGYKAAGVRQFTTDSGLPHNVIHGIEEDSFGRLWLSTDMGLSCFNPMSGLFINYTDNDGLQSRQFCQDAHCRVKNGTMYFGGINGITRFNPEKLQNNRFTPAPIITGLSVFNKAVKTGDKSGILSKSISLTDRIDLSHKQNSIAIRFSVTNYLAKKNNTFSYKLEGFDKEWYTSTANTIYYSNLGSGTYVFKVMAANNDGKWNTTPTELTIKVHSAWYATNWATLLFMLLGLGIIVAAVIFTYEHKRMNDKIIFDEQDRQRQDNLHQMKTRFFINMSHELRTPLTLILNPLHDMIARESDPWMRKQLKYIERNTKRLSYIINQMMDYRKAELGVFKLNVKPETAQKILSENFDFYSKTAKDKKLKYTFISDIEERTFYIDGQYVELILNNLLSNAFKYTDSGSITVKAYVRGNNLAIEVSDTGIGIPKADQERIFGQFNSENNENIGNGIGLSLVRKLVELHHGTIELASEEGKGSTFTVLLPQDLSVYSEEEIGRNERKEIFSDNTRDMYVIENENNEIVAESSDKKKSGKILLAVANQEVREYMKEALSGIFEILTSEKTDEIMEILTNDNIDVVLVDMSGENVKICSKIKQNNDTSFIPVFVISSKADGRHQLNAMKAGADDYIVKPFSMEVLIAKIRNIIRTMFHLEDKTSGNLYIAPEKVTFNAMDEKFLNQAMEIVSANIANPDFSTEEFAKAMNMSRSNLHIRLKAITGVSSLEFIRKIRFVEACKMLKEGSLTVSEISYKVGFNSPSYFATCFKKYMGCLPTEYGK